MCGIVVDLPYVDCTPSICIGSSQHRKHAGSRFLLLYNSRPIVVIVQELFKERKWSVRQGSYLPFVRLFMNALLSPRKQLNRADAQ